MLHKLLSKLLVVGLVLSLFVSSGVVIAQTTGDEQTQTQNDSTETSQETDTLAERLANRKDKMKTRLQNFEKLRLQNRCKAAQGRTSSLEGRIKGIETSRTQVYDNLLSRLKKVSEKLDASDQDVTELESQIVVLDEKIANFYTDLAAYKQAVTDLIAMDCESDPEAFKASLEEARELRKILRASGEEIRAYLKETIKPTLVELKKSLGDDKPQTEEES